MPLDLSPFREIAILTGAGVSAASGLPTYRGPGGLWQRANIEAHATAAAMRADPERVWEFFSKLRAELARATPNAAHFAIARMETRLRSDQRLTVLTQNVDGLHTLAGSSRVVELHGTLRRSRCTACDYTRPEDVNAPLTPCPRCDECGALLRPSVVLFDEPLPVDAEWESKKVLRDCDLFIAVGTSGTVAPASNFARAAKYAGARTIYVNLEPMTPENPAFTEVVLGRAEQILPELLGTPG